MSLMSQLALIREMLESSESSLRSAKQLLNEISGGQMSKVNYGKIAEKLPDLEEETGDSRSKIIEGVFDGQNMAGKDKNMYPVPANYASKSKLIPGDVLKLTITNEGSFLYKQIGPIERKTILGTLTIDNGKYKVLAGGKVYNVLLASVTYFKGEVGDQVSLIVPETGDSAWGAIEAIIPQVKVDGMPMGSESFESEKEEPQAIPKEKKTRKSKKAAEEDDGLGNLDV
jgi:hypothetical protein